MIAKTQEQIEMLREAGIRMSQVAKAVMDKVAPGISSWELEEEARRVTQQLGARCSYLGYSEGTKMKNYPTALCVSINNEIAHSPARKEKMLKEGDVLSVDFGLDYQGYFMDMALTVIVGGGGDASAQNLIKGTREALDAAVAAAVCGKRTGDIGAATEAVAKKYGLGVVEELRGHGVGAAVHELPYVDNYGDPGEGEKLTDGLVVALEPIFAEKSGDMVEQGDGFTYITRDGSRAAHFEQTILITKDGTEVLTPFL
jgi:methionyl aminopeptidase